MKKELKIKEGIEIKIKKGIPAGFGMGSSAGSAAASAVAFNKLFKLKLNPNSLVKFAGFGEKASAGSIHYDNVAASVLGGFVIVKTDPLDVITIDPPMNLRMCIAVPKMDVPKKKTKVSRGVIPKKVKLTDAVLNISQSISNLEGFDEESRKSFLSDIRDIAVADGRFSDREKEMHDIIGRELGVNIMTVDKKKKGRLGY